jgi:hypothetical protein
MNTVGICGGLIVAYYIIGLVFVFSQGTGNLFTGLFLSLVWPILILEDVT